MGKALPNRIREWRKRKSLTIEKLSELAKISPGYLQRMETGGRNVSLKNLDLISAALQVPKQELVSDIEYMKAPLVGYVGAGAETHTFADGQGPFDYVDAPPTNPAHFHLLLRINLQALKMSARFSLPIWHFSY